MDIQGRITVNGLSPRVRGNRLPHLFHRQMRRSIPACAGEPSQDLYERIMETVYPRVCGGTPS